MSKPRLKPTIEQSFIIVPDPADTTGAYDFGKILEDSHRLEREGQIQQACDMRYQAFQRLYELLPENHSETQLEWEDDNTRAALMLINLSSIDHFLIGDFEMCAGMLELLLDLDPEDHLDATTRLGYTYIAMGEYDLYDEITNDISDRYPDKTILSLWSDFRRSGTINDGYLRRFKSRFADYFKEFTSTEHTADAAYLAEIEKDHPSRAARAREMWLQTEHLWKLYPDFIEALRNAKQE